jgi:hypothetical protein
MKFSKLLEVHQQQDSASGDVPCALAHGRVSPAACRPVPAQLPGQERPPVHSEVAYYCCIATFCVLLSPLSLLLLLLLS